MLRRAYGAAFAASLALAAGSCGSAVDATPPVVSVATPVVWAGGSIVLTASHFSGTDTLPIALVGDDTVAVRYAPPDSFFVTAPDTQGAFDLRVAFSGRQLQSAGTVHLEGGYRSMWTASPLGRHPVAWPGGTHSSFAIALDSGLAIVDPKLRTVAKALPDSVFSISCINGTGPATGGRTTAMGRHGSVCGPLTAVRPDSPWVAPDTGPAGLGRFAAELAPGRWLVAYQHGVISEWRDATGPRQTGSCTSWRRARSAVPEPCASSRST